MYLKISKKKSDLPDVLIFLVVTFILCIGAIVFAFIIPEITDGLRVAGLNESIQGSANIDYLENWATTGLQKGFFFLIIGLMIGTMISAFLINLHPIFIVLYIFIGALTLFIGTYLGNAFEQFLTTTPQFESLVDTQPFITMVMQNIVLITLVVLALSIIITFSKFSSFTQRVP